MLRKSAPRVNWFGGLRPGTPTPPKHSDLPGVWGPAAGPQGDTLARRYEFGKYLVLHKVGQLTAPFKTRKVVWVWRRFQARVFKVSAFLLVSAAVFIAGNVWILLVSHGSVVGSATPVLERKVREHRVSKQIITMVREREKELTVELEQSDAERLLKAREAKA